MDKYSKVNVQLVTDNLESAKTQLAWFYYMNILLYAVAWIELIAFSGYIAYKSSTRRNSP